MSLNIEWKHPTIRKQVDELKSLIGKKTILEKTISFYRKDWATKLDDAFWAY